jgi:hypothetical protein
MPNNSPIHGFAFPAPPSSHWKRVAGFAAFCLALATIAAFVYADVAEASQASQPHGYGSYGESVKVGMGSFEGY